MPNQHASSRGVEYSLHYISIKSTDYSTSLQALVAVSDCKHFAMQLPFDLDYGSKLKLV